jgi:hypothetical protein
VRRKRALNLPGLKSINLVSSVDPEGNSSAALRHRQDDRQEVDSYKSDLMGENIPRSSILTATVELHVEACEET